MAKALVSSVLFAVVFAIIIWVPPPSSAQGDSAPTIDHVVLGDQSLTVAWSEPAGVTGVTAYDMRYITSSASVVDKADPNSWTAVDDAWTGGRLAAMVTGLTNGVSYDVQVRAVVASDGAWSSTSTGTPVDPGGTPAGATALVAGLRVQGVISAGDDVDYFSLVLSETSEFFAVGAGATDTSAQLYNSRGRLLLSDDGTGVISGGYKFRLADLLSAGIYYLRVSGSGSATGSYTLHMGASQDSYGLADATPIGINEMLGGVLARSPRSTSPKRDYFTFELKQARWAIIHISGLADPVGALTNSSGGVLQSFHNTDLASPDQGAAISVRLSPRRYYIRVSSWEGRGGRYFVRLATLQPGSSTSASADPLELGTLSGGTIDSGSDVDYFKLELAEPQRVLIEALSSSAAVSLELRDSNDVGVTVKNRQYADSTNSRYRGTSSRYSDVVSVKLQAGVHYVRVSTSGPLNRGGYLIVAGINRYDVQDSFSCDAPPTGIEDSYYGCQWHLSNRGQTGGTSGEDINIEGAWATTTGSGVSVVIVDDGLDYRHEDLHRNVLVSRNHSYRGGGDVYASDSLRFLPISMHSHGTHVAGIIAAEGNNIGIRGVAPDASIYAYDMLLNGSTLNRADAAARNRVVTDVSNNSWGSRLSANVERAGRLWELAIESGLRDGSNGNGTFYVFGAGNSHTFGGLASLNEYANFYGVSAACAVDANGKRAGYSEQGSNLWVCAPVASWLDRSKRIPSTDSYDSYNVFGGTSAAAPVVSGVAALVRSVDSTLSWRDVKLILANSARKNDASSPGWDIGALKYGSTTSGYSFSHQYGFGVVDAAAAVDLAGSWSKVPELRTATASHDVSRTVAATRGSVASSVKLEGDLDFVEFVEVTADFDAPRFRQLSIELVSPSGNVSTLSTPSSSGCYAASPCPVTGVFRFGSAMHLGEDPRGTWTLRIADRVRGGDPNIVKSWDLKVYGHRAKPGPVSLRYVRPVAQSLTVAWDRPDYAGSGDAAGYEIRYIRSDAGNKADSQWTVQTADCSVSSCTQAVQFDADDVHSRDIQVRAIAGRPGDWSAAARGTPGASNSEPFFVDGERTVRRVEENSGASAEAGDPVYARDYETDSGPLAYSLSGVDADSFSIDNSTGQITADLDHDHEDRSAYSLTVSVTDGKADDGTSDTRADDTITVGVEIVDVDEPAEILGPGAIEHSENSAADVASYEVDDPEGETAALVLGGADAGQFLLVDGVVRFRDPPDHEMPEDAGEGNTYDIALSATLGAQTAERVVRVTVTDIDEPPAFTDAPTEALKADENIDSALSLYALEAMDPEQQGIAWTLAGADRLDFTIVGGVLKFAASPDFEMPADDDGNNVYEVSVVASDAGGLGEAAEVRVQVQDLNEQAEISGDATVNYPENGTGAVGAYRANDPEERENAAWTLSGADAGSFEIRRTSGGGVLRFAAPPDHEAKHTYSVTLQTSDRKDANGEDVLGDDPDVDDRFEVTVNVTDEPERPSITKAPAGATVIVAEGHTGEVTRYGATDPEGRDITWTLSGSDRGDLTIQRATGAVTFVDSPDFENATDSGRDNSYVVDVAASDGQDTATLRLTVTVTNEPEAGSVSFSSAQPQDSTRFAATVSDPDGGVTAVAWTWERSLGRSTWSAVSRGTGSSYTPSASDEDFYLRATALYRDRESGAHSRSAQAVSANPVRLNTGVNHAPGFPETESGRRSVPENSPTGVGIGGPIAAADPDSGDQDKLTYTMRDSDERVFGIDPGSGQLRTREGVTLDHETKPSHSIEVTVRDPSGLTDAQSVTIEVADVDEAPVVSGPATPSFKEDQPYDTTPVGRYRAADPERERLAWSVAGPDAGDFEFDETTRELRFASQPDFDSGSRTDYEVTVVAREVDVDGEESLAGELAVKVRVTDVNEAPVVSGPHSVAWQENRTGTVGRYSAIDPEGDVTPTWSLGGNDASLFEIDDSGSLSFKAAPNFENRDNTYVVKVHADDGPNVGELEVSVVVEDEDEPGSLELSPSMPAVGRPVTARLDEPDADVRDRTWKWERSEDRLNPTSWNEIPNATTARYQPVFDDLSRWLRATVTYRDVHDTDTEPLKSVTKESLNIVTLTVPNRATTTGARAGSSSSGGEFDVGVATVVVANGWSPADVGVASVMAARTGSAVVTYTAGDELSPETSMLLREVLPAEVIIVGGLAAVSRDVRTQIRAASGDSGITRIAGADRADTAAGAARQILGSPSESGRVTLIVANGWSPPDIGAATALASRSGRSAVLYTQRDRLPEQSAALLRDYRVARVIVIGGTAAISTSVADAIAAATGDASISRLTGADRLDTAAQAARRVLGNPAAAPDGTTLVIANGWSPPDVGVAAALAAATENAAVAYTAQGTLPEATAALIRDYRPASIIIIGGRAAVSNDVRTALTSASPNGADVRRLTGQTRTDTAVRAARRILGSF